MSSGSPFRQAAKPGDASRLLSVIARAEAILGGEEGLEVEDADALERRLLDLAGSAGQVEVCARRARRARGRWRAGCARGCGADRRRCRAGRAGPRPTTAPARAWRRRRSGAPRAARRRSAAPRAGAPRRCPACRSRSPPRRAGAAIRSPSWPQSASPLRQSSAVHFACSSGVRPCAGASPSSIQGRKSAGCSSGKVSSRLPRSPFGSMTMAGMPSIAASSSSAMHRPVLPLPVMPTQTRVGGQVLGVVEDRLVGDLGRALGAGRLQAAAEVEGTQLFVDT